MLNRKIILIFVLVVFLPLPAQILDTVLRFPNLVSEFYHIPVGNKLYVIGRGGSGSACVFVVDCGAMAIRRVINLYGSDNNFHPAIYNQRHNKIYQAIRRAVSSRDTMGLAVIDNRNDSVIRYLPIPVDELGIALNTTLDKVYTVGEGRITVLDCSTDTVVKVIVPTSHTPAYFAIWDSVGNQMYFGWRSLVRPTDFITVVDCDTDSIIALIRSRIWWPDCAVYNPLRRKLYVGSTNDGGFSIIDCVSNTLIRRLPIAQVGDPRGHVYCVREDKVYWLAPDSTEAVFYVIDGQRDTVVNLITFPRGDPWCSAYAEWSNRLYAFAKIRDSFIVYVIDCRTDSVIGQGAFQGRLPDCAFANPVDKRIYLLVYWDLAIYVFKDSLQGIAEGQIGSQVSQPLVATFIRNILFLPETRPEDQAVLMDVTGRKVLDLKPGPNDVHHIAPGVYFIRTQTGDSRITRVVITR